MLLALFKAGLDLIMSHDGAAREAYITELKTAMYRYLEPMLHDDEDDSGDGSTGHSP